MSSFSCPSSPAIADNAPRLPDNVSFAEGALLEPLSVVLHGINSAPITLGTPVVVCGAGPIGLLALAAARASGAYPLVITDVEPKRLAFAKEMVPSAMTYQVEITKSAEENGKAVRELFGESEYVQPRVALECTGVESSVTSAAYMVRRGGILMVVGVGRAIMNNLPFMHLSLAEVCFFLVCLADNSELTRDRSNSDSSTDTRTPGQLESPASREV